QPAGEADAFFFGGRDRKIFKLPGDAWTAPEQKLSRYLPVFVTVKDGKLTVANMRDLRRHRGDSESGQDQDYVRPYLLCRWIVDWGKQACPLRGSIAQSSSASTAIPRKCSRSARSQLPSPVPARCGCGCS